jgi:hypothetical protein
VCRFFIGPTIGSILGAVNGAAAAMVSMVVSLVLIAVALPETCRPKPEALQGESVVFDVPPCQFAVFYPYASLLRPGDGLSCGCCLWGCGDGVLTGV